MNEPDTGLLSLNTATVRQQWTLPEIVDGCARHGIRGIAPWRDQVAAAGLKDAALRIRDAGLTVTGYCRGGMFSAVDREGRTAQRSGSCPQVACPRWRDRVRRRLARRRRAASASALKTKVATVPARR